MLNKCKNEKEEPYVHRWDIPNATRSPSSDMGIVVNSGRKKMRNTGTSASVRKKFQCTPYSVTCSFIYHPSSAVLSYI